MAARNHGTRWPRSAISQLLSGAVGYLRSRGRRGSKHKVFSPVVGTDAYDVVAVGRIQYRQNQLRALGGGRRAPSTRNPKISYRPARRASCIGSLAVSIRATEFYHQFHDTTSRRTQIRREFMDGSGQNDLPSRCSLTDKPRYPCRCALHLIFFAPVSV